MAIVAETARGLLSTSALEPDVYLTDGIRLFRVVRGFAWPAHESEAVLEDCLTLEECAYSPDELWAMGVTVVGAGVDL
jgi:hypothetical protein